MSNVNIETVIIGIEAVVLLATLIFMYYQYRKTMSVMSDELSEIRREIRITTHEDIYEKLFTLYYKYIEYADDLKDIFREYSKLDTSEVRKQYMVFAVLDLLYLMYLQKDTLDRGLLKTWDTWVKKVFEEPKIFEIYETVKDEYDLEYIKYIENLYNKSKEVSKNV